MSNAAYKSKALQNTAIHTSQMRQNTTRSLVEKKSRLTSGEKILLVAAALFISIMAFRIITVQAEIYSINEKVQNKEAKVTDKQRKTDDLSIEVKSLSRYERIYQIAKKKGLDLNSNNVKVVGSN